MAYMSFDEAAERIVRSKDAVEAYGVWQTFEEAMANLKPEAREELLMVLSRCWNGPSRGSCGFSAMYSLVDGVLTIAGKGAVGGMDNAAFYGNGTPCLLTAVTFAGWSSARVSPASTTAPSRAAAWSLADFAGEPGVDRLLGLYQLPQSDHRHGAGRHPPHRRPGLCRLRAAGGGDSGPGYGGDLGRGFC